MQEPSDEELDAWVLVRLRMAGVDLEVLPEDDPGAPADRRRILASARSFLRSTPGVIRGLELTHEGVAPVLYPAASASPPRRPEEP